MKARRATPSSQSIDKVLAATWLLHVAIAVLAAVLGFALAGAVDWAFPAIQLGFIAGDVIGFVACFINAWLPDDLRWPCLAFEVFTLGMFVIWIAHRLAIGVLSF